MTRFITSILAAGIVTLLPGSVLAQSESAGEPHIEGVGAQGKSHYYGHKGHEDMLEYQDAHMHKALEENMPEGVSIPGGPRFAFAGKDNKFYMAISGFAKATASYDFGSVMDNPNEFVTSAIPMNPEPGNGGLLQFSAMQTFLALNIVALPDNANRVGFFIGANLLNDYGPQLQHAYLKWRGLKAGYDVSIFSDPGAVPAGIDFEGPNSITTVQTTLVSYTAKLGKNKEWEIGGGFENPFYSVTAGDGTASVNQRIPDIPVFAKYSWGEGDSWVRVSGILRNMQYRDLLKEKNFNKVGWGVQVSGSAAVNSFLTAYWQGVYGDGIASHIQDLTDLNLDMVPGGDGKMKSVKAWGGMIGLQYNLGPNVFATTTYSHVRTYADRYAGGDISWGEQYRYAQYAAANVFWNINSSLQTGLEYIYGRRVNYSGEQAHDNRIQASIQLSF